MLKIRLLTLICALIGFESVGFSQNPTLDSPKATFTFFQPTEFVETGSTVVAIGSQKYRLLSDGKEYLSNWMMYWRFKNGVPVSFKELFDVQPLN